MSSKLIIQTMVEINQDDNGYWTASILMEEEWGVESPRGKSRLCSLPEDALAEAAKDFIKEIQEFHNRMDEVPQPLTRLFRRR